MPYRLPSFIRCRDLNDHQFEVNRETYEYVDGQYFTRVATLGAGKSFGDIALQRKCLTNANIKTERETHFAYMTRDAYINQIKKISEEMEQDRVTFLKNLPLFKPITRMTVLSFYWEM